MLSIGQFSKLSKISVKTLRYYDKIGLLKPAMISPSSYRYYTEAQLETVRLIAMYKEAGLSNDLITRLLGGAEDNTPLLEYQKRLFRVLPIQADSFPYFQEVYLYRCRICLQ